MNLQKAEFSAAYGLASQLPGSKLPEIAFSGRSNVGKSSLLNRLFNRKSLARVSSVPGKTITVNFYNCGDVNLVDLPGYGFAKRSKKEVARLDQMIRGYILGREQLANVFVLVDVRLEPQAIDQEFINWLGLSSIPFSIVFTKADKLSATKVRDNVAAYERKLLETWEEMPPYFVTSSEKGTGRDEVLGYIEQINKELHNS